jgi:hypothetical protein
MKKLVKLNDISQHVGLNKLEEATFFLREESVPYDYCQLFLAHLMIFTLLTERSQQKVGMKEISFQTVPCELGCYAAPDSAAGRPQSTF